MRTALRPVAAVASSPFGRDGQPLDAGRAAGFFWNVAFAGALVVGAMAVYAAIVPDRLTVDGAGRTVVKEEFLDAYIRELPEFIAFQDAVLDATVEGAVADAIESRVDAAFAPVEGNIDAYLDYHYSISGQYTELATFVFADIGAAIEERLYDEVGFETAMAAAADGIHADADAAFGVALGEIRGESRERLGFSPRDLGAAHQAMVLTRDNLESRFSGAYLAMRGAGTLIGARFGGRALAELGEALARRGARIAAQKGLTRAAAATTSGGAGAAACSWSGPWAAACGIVAAVVAYAVTDVVALELDEWLTRDAFRDDLAGMIAAHKAEVKASLLRDYAAIAEEVSALNADALIGFLPEGGPATPLDVLTR